LKCKVLSLDSTLVLKEFLEPMQITQQTLAQEIGVPYQRVNELVNGKRGVTPSTALRLAKYFGNSPDFWLNLQNNWEVYHVHQAEAEQLKNIKPLVLVNSAKNII
jgi:antitoxin HigA-1